MVGASAQNPFSNTHVLSGLELFVHNDGDGAAVAIGRQLYQTLYLPHIPTELEQFWTGFALVNPNEQPATAHIQLFADQGESVGTYTLPLPAHTKVQGLLSSLFPDAAGASWGIISSDVPISGIEIYGTDSGGICGFALSGLQYSEATLPLAGVDSDHWTGVSFANPGMTDATVTVQLLAADGTVRGQQIRTIAAGTRLAILLTDLFPNLDVQPTDHIRIVSDQAIIALEVSGDLTNSTLMAVPAMD